jgi:hypothetical protein
MTMTMRGVVVGVVRYSSFHYKLFRASSTGTVRTLELTTPTGTIQYVTVWARTSL